MFFKTRNNYMKHIAMNNCDLYIIWLLNIFFYCRFLKSFQRIQVVCYYVLVDNHLLLEIWRARKFSFFDCLELLHEYRTWWVSLLVRCYSLVVLLKETLINYQQMFYSVIAPCFFGNEHKNNLKFKFKDLCSMSNQMWFDGSLNQT